MDEAEKKIEEYTAKHRKTEDTTETKPNQDAEEKVEKKAREGNPIAKSVLQKRTQLSETDLNRRIDQFLNAHPKIDEQKFRERVADTLEQNDRVTEADLVNIQETFLAALEEQSPDEQKPGIQPPPFLNDSLTAAGNRARIATDWMSGLKTPGGVGFLVFVLVFFVWIIVPVNDANQTRLQLLWGILTGQTGFNQSIKDQEAQLATQAAADSGVGYLFPNFGGGSVKPIERQMIPVEMPFVPSFEE